jgi:hypothetical protein
MGRPKGSLNRNAPAIHRAVHFLAGEVFGPLTGKKAKRVLENPAKLAEFYSIAGIHPDNPPTWSTIERWINLWKDVPYQPGLTFTDLERRNARALLRDDPFRYSVKAWRELYPFLNQSYIYQLRRKEAGPRRAEWLLIADHPYAMIPTQRRKLFPGDQPIQHRDPDQHDLLA